MRFLASAALGAIVLAVGCSSSQGSSPSTSSQTQPVQGGSVDTTHNYAVGVCVGGGPGQCQLLCSGALIAPNLVMTARHCVDQSPTQIDCTNPTYNTFGALRGSAGNYWITTYYQMFQSSNGWHQATKIVTTPGTAVCGNDMAFIILGDNVSASAVGGSFVTPVVQYPMTDHTRYKTTVTAIGYGDTSATTQDAGTRHIRQNVNLLCIPGDSVIDCGTQSQINAKEFVSGDSTCEGDSGSSAFEQVNFNKNIPVSFGVLSRGGSSGSTCVQPVYTRTDSWSSFVISTAQTAASMGGYAPPAWTQPPPPADAGTPTQDSGTPTADSGATTTPGSLGAACTDNTQCDSGLCATNDNGQTYVCSAPCDPTGDGTDCAPSGYACVAQDDAGTGYCFSSSSTWTNTNSGGCALAPTSDPSKPVPWGSVALAGIWAVATLGRRRRR
jgi:hypothetical protein